MSLPQASMASTCLPASAACEPTWNDRPRTGMPSLRASRASSSRSSGSQPNLRDRSHTAPGRAERHAQQQLALVAVGLELADLVGIVGDEDLHAEMQRVADVDVALDRMGVDAARRVDAELRDELRFAGGREIQPAAELDDGLHHGRVRQRLQRVVQVDARQRLVQLAVLLAHALAVDDQQRRAELRHQPVDLRRLERIDVRPSGARLRVRVSNACSFPKRGEL